MGLLNLIDGDAQHKNFLYRGDGKAFSGYVIGPNGVGCRAMLRKVILDMGVSVRITDSEVTDEAEFVAYRSEYMDKREAIDFVHRVNESLDTLVNGDDSGDVRGIPSDKYPHDVRGVPSDNN